MAKFRKNDIVSVKTNALSKTARCIIRDIRTELLKDNKVKVTYILEDVDKNGRLTGKFRNAQKKALTLLEREPKAKNSPTKNKPKYTVFYVDKSVCGHAVTVVAKVENTVIDWGLVNNEVPNVHFMGVRKFNVRRMSVGYAIQHESDEENKKMGAMVAKKRCDKRPMATYYSPQACEFRDDIVEAVCKAKLNYIVSNIEKFVGENEE